MTGRTKILIRATNWLGDCVMSLPALRALRTAMPGAHLTVLARPSVADLYTRESCIDAVMPCTAGRREMAAGLRREAFDWAILLPNSFDSALVVWMAGIPRRTGYRRDCRGWLLTDSIRPPQPGEIPRHERFYYLELLRRAGIIYEYPGCAEIRLAPGAGAAQPCVGVSPGAAYGSAKRWLPERFAEAASAVARAHGAEVALFGSAAERELCESVAALVRDAGVPARNCAGETSLAQFIELAAACRLFLTNDSGAMHIASALGVPTVTVFGPTDDTTTGPTGSRARILRELVDCGPCLLRVCPIDHRCMTRISAARVTDAALALWEETEPA